jgi:phosphatidylglycerol:prolipoprotein diacylglycerol transferase
MFPYVDTARWHAGTFAIEPLPFSVAIALAVAYMIAVGRAKRSGIGHEQFSKFSLSLIIGGFLGGHLAMFAYSPGSWRILTIEPMRLLYIFQGQASFGAFLGGPLGALLFLWCASVPRAQWYLYVDAIWFAVPFSWWLGRVGCYLVHDHPGIRTTSFLGVRYPGGTRYDLGLLEALFLIALAGVFLFLDRKPRIPGFYCVTFLLSYGTFRLFLDSLHVDPPRYLGWTVDQIAATLMITGGALALFKLMWDRTRPI